MSADATGVDPDRLVADLRALVAVPSVSADPARADDVRASATLVAEMFRGTGIDAVVVEVEGGLPAVVGRREGPPGAPTVLLYAHHDVQPVDGAWTTEPFALEAVGDRLHGRGSADDKGGVAVHLETLRALGTDPPVGVAVLVEGEEEVGSPTLGRLLEQHLATIRADVVLAPDAVNPDTATPSLTVSLRGLLTAAVTVRVGEKPLHSGIFGGAVPDALTALVVLLATLVDEDGAPAVHGLHPGSDTSTSGPDEPSLRQASGVRDGVALVGTGELGHRMHDRPSLSVLGVDAPPVAGAGNVLHPVARAAVGLRLAPEDDPQDALAALARHVERHRPWGVEVEVVPSASGSGWRATPAPVADLAREALAEAFGVPPVDVGVGGGIPFVAAVARALPDAQVLVTGVQDDRTNAHAPDESVATSVLVAAARAQVLLLRRLAERTPTPDDPQHAPTHRRPR